MFVYWPGDYPKLVYQGVDEQICLAHSRPTSGLDGAVSGVLLTGHISDQQSSP